MNTHPVMGGTIVLNHRIYALANAYASVDASRELDSNDDEPAEETTEYASPGGDLESNGNQ